MTRRLDLAMLLLLTFSTGMVDAIGYLGFDKVFTGNMTGNVVILGMGLAGADGVPVLRPALALVFFMVGAALSGRILGDIGEAWHRRTTLIYGIVAAGCAALSIYVAVVPDPEIGLAGTIFTSALSALMGAQAAAARKMKIADVTTVVVTSTIVGLASDSRLAGGDSTRWVRRFLAVVLILIGALAGAATLMLNQWIGIAIVAVLVAATTVIGHLGEKKKQTRAEAADPVPSNA
ncbi:YoaK family protein [Brevibacterium epidermidis]|uniref:YoaK family protein n=1 Tax=Brevibacterium epidermidis TaxID=1698 RepID=UPI000780E70C|nr:YoaK family protein [Brevibacterium epidermidis]